MSSHDRIKAYTDLVCEQIRWKKMRPRVSAEMSDHLTDTRDAYLEQGLDEAAATEKAVIDTGDAIGIGTWLDRIHRPRPQWGMLAAVMTLILAGMVLNRFAYVDRYSGQLTLLLDPMLHAAIGAAVLMVSYFADFTWIGKCPRVGCLATGALAVFLLWSSSRRIAGVSFYTCFCILLFPLAIAAAIYAARNKRNVGAAMCGLAYTAFGAIALSVPSISGFFLVWAAGFALLLAAGLKHWFGVSKVSGILYTLAPAALLAALFAAYLHRSGQWEWLTIALNPSIDPLNRGYTATMVQELLRGATIIGRGIVPEPYVSFMDTSTGFHDTLFLSKLASRFGWGAFAAVVGVMLLLILNGIRLCRKQTSGLGFFVSLAILLTIGLQAVNYLMYNLGFQFAAPISFPFVSYGKIAMVLNAGLTGVMLSVFRIGHAVTEPARGVRRDSGQVCLRYPWY